MALLIGPENAFAKLCALLFVLCLDVFWFYTIFHIVVITFSYFHRPKPIPASITKQPTPPVALLYVTYDDFQASCASSLINQDYDNYHTFILDDSATFEYRRIIDTFAATFPSKVSVIRRDARRGFKAGNLNHALALLADKYEYFAIADSDSVFSSDFISKTLAYFSLGNNIGFVQAFHKLIPGRKTYFAEAMGFNLELHYKRYLLPKERYGFVMFYGHGALIRTDLWRKIGGFPEMVSEDLAFSTKLRRYGYEGILAEDVFCYEDYPATYKQYRRRTEKWIKGTLEFLFEEYPLFLKAKGVSWFEKFDVLACALSLTMGLPFLLFLLIGAIALPFYFVNFRFHGPVFISPIPEGKTAVSMLTGLRYNVYWTYDFYIMMLVTIFYPLIPVFVDLIKKPARMLLYMSVSTLVFLSTLIWVSFQTVSYLIFRRADFLVTAHESPRSNARHLLMLAAEIIFAVALCAVMVTTKNLWLISAAAALLLSPFIFFWNLEKTTLRLVSTLPFLFSLVLLLLISKSIVR